MNYGQKYKEAFEKDEKVEKAIFGMVYDSDNELWSSYDVSKSDVLAWLDNPVDACVAMIEKLNELKML